MHKDIYSVLIAGKAGEGVKKAAQVIASIGIKRGCYVFQTDDYQSAIKGAHNFSTVSISKERIYNSYKDVELIISFDKRSVETHRAELKEGGLHFCDEKDAANAEIGLPLSSLVKEHYPMGGNMSLAAIAIFCAIAGFSAAEMDETIEHEFKRNLKENISFANAVYGLTKSLNLKSNIKVEKGNSSPAHAFTGNQLLSLGAWGKGLKAYFSYPMTPASSILHFYAKAGANLGVVAVHAESELAAANMALGSIIAGKPAAVGSSGGGFALMQEAFSMAGMIEAPLLCFLSSRPGPATGASTYTAQEDLYFALNQGHGEFPRIVASPDSFERAFTLSAELLQLAWESQSPAILLTEKHLSESMTNIELPLDNLCPKELIDETLNKSYQRYEITESGVSPMLFMGSGKCSDDDVVKWNTNEHLENGIRTDAAEDIIAMKNKRNRKQAVIEELSKRYTRVNEYGEGETLVFAYGSTALELREAMKYERFKLIVPIYLEPFPVEELDQYRGKKAIVVEHASRPHFARLLKEKLEIKSRDILRYDGRHFDALELAELIREAKNA